MQVKVRTVRLVQGVSSPWEVEGVDHLQGVVEDPYLAMVVAVAVRPYLAVAEVVGARPCLEEVEGEEEGLLPYLAVEEEGVGQHQGDEGGPPPREALMAAPTPDDSWNKFKRKLR